MDLDSLAIALLVGSAIVLAAVLGVRFAGKLGIPGLLLYLGLGLVLGSIFPELNFSDASLATVLGYAALVVILAEGGLTTRMSDLRPVLWPSVALATVGVGVSIAIVAVVLVLVVGMDPQIAILIGAVLAATDAAAVFSVLRRLKLQPRLRSLLEAEAGFNDAPVVVLVVVIATGSFDADKPWLVPLIVLGEIIGGAVTGLAVGFAAKWILPRLALPAVGLYPIAVLSFLVGAYGLADLVHSSGFMATYVAALVVGSSRGLPHRRSVVGFAEGMAWIAQIGLFVMLGLLADPVRAVSSIWPALVAGLALVFLARPIAALVSLVPFRLQGRWVAFVGVAGLRGAVPIVFAAIPLGAGLPGAETVFDATLILVIVLTVAQTPVLPWAGRRLGVEQSDAVSELDVEAAPLDTMKAQLLGVDVGPSSQLAGLYLTDLRLPTGAVLSLIVREGRGFAPDQNTRIRKADRLMVVVTEEVREQTERRLREVSAAGRLASWDSGVEKDR